MNTFIMLTKEPTVKLPPQFEEDGRFSESLIKYLICRFSNIGDFVLDPFAGYGTVCKVSEEQSRRFGAIEIDNERANYIRSIVSDYTHIYNEDFFSFETAKMPIADLIITSAPYAWRNLGHNPFDGYSGRDFYEKYLGMIEMAARKMAEMTRKGGLVIIDTCNVLFDEIITTLAWDVKNSIDSVDSLVYKGEIVIGWSAGEEGFLGGSYGFGQDHSYCLVYKRK